MQPRHWSQTQTQTQTQTRPTAGLDVSAAGSILNLLQDLRAQLSPTMLIITHDLNVVGYVADGMGVMRQGKIIEMGTVNEMGAAPSQ